MKSASLDLLACVRCGRPLAHAAVAPEPAAPGEPANASRPAQSSACASCGAVVRVDDGCIDVVPDLARPRSWGARAMQSRWIAHVYERWWRPLAFGLSTRFGAPRTGDEVGLVVSLLDGLPGPWMDLSCGPGLLTRALLSRCADGAVVAVDLSRAMLARARREAPGALLVRADAAHLPFRDGVFGAVANLAALDLYEDAGRVIAEAARVLRRGGRWVASTFVSGAGAMDRDRRAPLRSPLGGSRKPTERELARAAEEAGLQRFGVRRFRGYIVAWADKG